MWIVESVEIWYQDILTAATVSDIAFAGSAADATSSADVAAAFTALATPVERGGVSFQIISHLKFKHDK